MTIYEKLSRIQAEMKVPKELWNKFGNYSYRNAEGILEAFKPFEERYKVCLTVSDEMHMLGNRFYVKAIAILHDLESAEKVEASAFAREGENKKGMDDSQLTGATSSYARKYALNGLFLLDDSKDADTDEFQNQGNASGTENKKRDNLSNKEVERLRTLLASRGVTEESFCKSNKVKSLNEVDRKNYEYLVCQLGG